MNIAATERINLRATREAKQIIEQAAALSGITVSAFMLQQAYEKALSLLSQRHVVVNEQDWNMIGDMLENPPVANDALKDLMALGEKLV